MLLSRPLRHRQRLHRGRGGFTLIELIIVMVLLLAATSMMSTTVASVARLQAINRENATAASAARAMIETLRSERLERVYARYNDDRSDDPAGPGTGPGSNFVVDGLDADPADPDGRVGEILFPGVDVAAAGNPIDRELRENVADAVFGLPRDLNGDCIIDGLDHTADYYILPVQVRLRWSGRAGTREYRTFATLCPYNWQ